MSLSWISRDGWLIITARTIRTLAQASIAVFFAFYLDLLGYSLTEIGLLITVGSVGSALLASSVIFIGEALGRRRLLIAFSLLVGVAGIGYALTDRYLLLAIITFFVGSMAISGGGPRGPFNPLETAALPDTVSAERRTDLYAVAGMGQRVARFVGTLSASLPVGFVAWLGLSELDSYKVMFVVYTVLMLLSAAVYLGLSPAIETRSAHRGIQNPFTLPSRRTIFSLAAIFSVDSFATRFVFFSLVALWFKTKFGLDLAEVSVMLAASFIMGGVSLWVSAKLSDRIGMLNTMVLTHIPAVVFTFVIPFAPWVWLAITFWFLRGFFSPMDNPPRQSYMMSIVNREERVAMAGINNVSQATVGAGVPALAMWLWQTVHASAPFVASGLFKTVYLTALYFAFRNVHPPQEQDAAARELEPAAPA